MISKSIRFLIVTIITFFLVQPFIPVSSSTITQLYSPSELDPTASIETWEGRPRNLRNEILEFQVFWHTTVSDPANIGSSLGTVGPASTSGTAAALSAGAIIDFYEPVIAVGAFVSRVGISYSENHPVLFRPIIMVAYDENDIELGSVSVSVLTSTDDPSDLDDISPIFLGLRSDVPFSYITIDYNYPFDINGQTFFFDDLMYVEFRGNTPGGDNVQVNVDDVTITFSAVTEPGDTTTTISNTNPGQGLANFRFLGTYYNVETSAMYTSPVKICIQYDDTDLSFAQERLLKIWHWGGSGWADVTISLDTENNMLCASVESLSWFGIAHKKSWLTPELIIIGLIILIIILWFIYTRYIN